MKTILFTNARDENNILEWTIHHKNLGFDNIFIFDHLSVNPISNILKGLNYVSVYYISDEFIPKCDLMKIAAIYSKNKGFDWLLYLDADEFLTIPLYNNVKDFINNYPNNDQIAINWILFGSNYLKNEPTGTMIESYIRSVNTADACVKCIVKPHKVISVGTPHYFILDNMNFSTGVLGNLHYEHQPSFVFTDKNIPAHKLPAFVAHYIYQSYEVYVRRKLSRKRDDINQPYELTYDEETFNNLHNNTECTIVRDLYNDKNKQTMNEYLSKYNNGDFNFFNPSIYKSLYTDLQNMSNKDAETHYFNFGIKENRFYRSNPNNDNILMISECISKYNYEKYKDFNPTIYKSLNNDLKHMSDEQATQHFYNIGIKEARKYRSDDYNDINRYNIFDPIIYKSLNHDIKYMSNEEATQHFYTFGIKENRKFRTSQIDSFDPVIYKNLYNDLTHMTNEEATQHYYNHGIKEGRIYR